jgi:hypothetical protein
MPTNLTQCRLDYSNPSADDIARYGWSGPVKYIPRNATTQISFNGCETLCGTGSQLYPWGQVSSTITTWVLPVVGILVQAPFNSNAFWETIFSLARWIGSPMASFSYILWNIKVSGKCALLVDLAVEYGDESNNEDFLSIRDSFYLLMTMNQYTMKQDVLQKKEAEGLLRIALFSKDLRLLKPNLDPISEIYRDYLRRAEPGPQVPLGKPGQVPIGPSRPDEELEKKEVLEQLRQSLASDLRFARRRGVVPVFISTLWFVFSLGLSIQAAFGFLGENAQAHDLALGLLLAWLPVLILSSIVDRNPVASNDIRIKLNALIDRVRLSLMDDTVKQDYLRTITDVGHQTRMVEEVEKRSRACPDLEEFFVKFAGQGRKRFHYGVAHPILTDIEQAYIAEKGRNWLADEKEARTILVLGDALGGLDWLDPRELWQVLSAVVIVGGTILGAFCLSYFTPTVGVGCRSGGYMVFGSVSFGLLLVEMILWWAFDSSKQEMKDYGRRLTVNHPNVLTWYENKHLAFIRKRSALFEACNSFIWTQLRNLTPHEFARVVEMKCEKYRSAPLAVDAFFFRPVECFNIVWLTYITMSQTTGHYNNCRCKSSLWFGGGGYIDWNNYDTATSPWVRLNWAIATSLSSTIMAVAMLYIVTEWCLQSHLSTANLKNATKGLRHTRRFRWLTSPFRDTIHYLIEYSYAVRRAISSFIRRFCCCCRRRRRGNPTDATPPAGQARPTRQNRRSVRWTSKWVAVDREAQLPSPPPSPGPSRRNSDVELQHLDPSRPRASSNAPSDVPSDAPLIRPSYEGRRDSSISPSTSSGGRTSSGGEASSSRLPRASGESSAGPGRGSGGSDTLQVPVFNLAHYGSESV